MLEFRDVEITDSILFEEYAQEYFGVEACFGNIFLWRKSWHIKLAHEEQALYLLMENGDCPSFMLPPFMKDENAKMCEAIKKCEEYMRSAYDMELMLKGATVPIMERIERDCPGRFAFIEDRPNFEYVYNRQDLAELSGKKYHSKRNHINKLLSQHSYEFVDFKEEYYERCMQIHEKWIESKGGMNEDFEDELFVAKEAFANRQALGVRIGVLFIDGRLAGYTIGEKYRNMAVIHIEKADPDIQGVFNLINREFVRERWQDVEFINREEDMGLEGMRKSKLSYYPAYLIEKFDCVRRK